MDGNPDQREQTITCGTDNQWTPAEPKPCLCMHLKMIPDYSFKHFAYLATHCDPPTRPEASEQRYTMVDGTRYNEYNVRVRSGSNVKYVCNDGYRYPDGVTEEQKGMRCARNETTNELEYQPAFQQVIKLITITIVQLSCSSADSMHRPSVLPQISYGHQRLQDHFARKSVHWKRLLFLHGFCQHCDVREKIRNVSLVYYSIRAVQVWLCQQQQETGNGLRDSGGLDDSQVHFHRPVLPAHYEFPVQR